MKKCVLLIVVFIMMFSACSKKEEAESPDPKVKEGKAEYRLVAEIPYGERDEKKLGRISGKVSPNAFLVFDDGLVAIIDIYKQRIAEYRDNEFIREIKIDGYFNFEDNFTADNEKYYVFLNSPIYGAKVQIINRKDGSLEKEITVPREHALSEIYIWGGNVYYNHGEVRYLLKDDAFIGDDKYLEMDHEDSQYTVKQYEHEWHFSRSENDQYLTQYDYMGVDKNYNLFIKRYSQSYSSDSEVSIYKYNEKSKKVGHAVLQKGYLRHNVTEYGDVYVLTEEKYKKIMIYELILGNSD